MSNGSTLTMPATNQAAPAGRSVARRGERDDRAALAALLASHRGRVHRLVYRLLGWGDGAEDVVQDVFVAALKALPRFRGEADVATWLTAIAVNRCRSAHRRRAVRRKLLTMVARRWGREPPPPEGLAVGRETHRAVRAAVRSLPRRLREVVVLRYLEETPMERIAEVLGISRSAVGSRLHRARGLLAAKLNGLIEE